MSDNLIDNLKKEMFDFYRGLSEVEFEREYMGEFPKFPALVYVVALTYHRAKVWAEEEGCPKESFVYVSDYRVLERHSTGGYIVFCNGWHERRDSYKINLIASHLIRVGRLKHFAAFFKDK